MSQTTNSESNGMEKNIVHILSIFPKISPSMLHITLGSSIPKAMWNPSLESLIADGTVMREEHVCSAPNGRSRHYTLLSLVTIFPTFSNPTLD